MVSQEDFVLIPDINPTTPFLQPTAVRRRVAKLLIAAKDNNQSLIKLARENRLTIQQAYYISHYNSEDIDTYKKYHKGQYEF